MKIRKTAVACSTALALGATALVAPQSLAAPLQLEGKVQAPEVGCVVKGSTWWRDSVFSVRSSEDNRVIRPGKNKSTLTVAYVGDAQRILSNPRMTFTLRNSSSEDLEYSLTDAAQSVVGTGTIGPGETAEVVYEDSGTYEPAIGQKQEWKFNLQSVGGGKFAYWNTPIGATVAVEGRVEPWPMEDEQCRHYIPQGNNLAYPRGIFADGKPHDPNLKLWNSDYSYSENRDRVISDADRNRIEGTLYSRLGAKGPEGPIEGAEVSIGHASYSKRDGQHAHTLMLPYGFVPAGSPDDDKPEAVYLKLVAQPRPETKNSKYEIYREPFTLRRVEEDRVRSLDSHAEYVGKVWLTHFNAQFAPKEAYPGEVVVAEAEPREEGDFFDRIPENTVVKLSPDSKNSVVKNWNLRIYDGFLHLTIPEDATPGTVKFNVDFTYADGSVDKNVPIELIINDVVEYGEVTAKPGASLTLQPKKGTKREGIRYFLAEGQALEGWKVDLNKDGTLNVTVADKARDGDRKAIEVNLIYPNGEIGTAHAVVNVRDKSFWWWVIPLLVLGGIGAFIIDMLNRVPFVPHR